MKRALLTFAAPAYLLLCIVFGGSQQSAWANAALQIAAVLLLLWISISSLEMPAGRSARISAAFVLLTLIIITLQLVPLPPSLWSSLPGRELLVEGYRSLGMQLPWLPISQTPHDSVVTAFALLPALAMLTVVRVQDDERALAWALLGGTTTAIILGQLQVGAGDQWRFHEFSNIGPVGFFANINHMGTLLLVSVPFAVALLARQSKSSRRGYGGVFVTLIAVTLALLLIGVLLTGSLAALLLIGPVLLGSGMILPSLRRLHRIVLPITGLALLGAVYVLSTQPLQQSALAEESVSFSSRQQIWGNTVRAIGDSFPIGMGLGSFEETYTQYEDPGFVTSVYVNHAHNDYLELALELGAAGILLVLSFLAWWGWQAWRIWKSPQSKVFARAATIATAAVLAHSVVDYPLRTATIAAVFGMCIGLMIRQPSRPGKSGRHLRIA